MTPYREDCPGCRELRAEVRDLDARSERWRLSFILAALAVIFAVSWFCLRGPQP